MTREMAGNMARNMAGDQTLMAENIARDIYELTQVWPETDMTGYIYGQK